MVPVGRSPSHDAGIVARHVSHPIVQRGSVSPASSGAITKRKSWSQPHEARDLKADAKTRQAARAAAAAAAKARAATKAAAAIAAAAPHSGASNIPPLPTSPAAGGDPYAEGSDFMSSTLAQIAGRRRCGIGSSKSSFLLRSTVLMIVPVPQTQSAVDP